MQDFQEVSSYITEELNCLELRTEQNEDEYLQYKGYPDNKAIGQALGKGFNKQVKETIAGLTSDQLRKYLKDGKLKVKDLKIEAGWLRVEKLFTDKYQKSKEHACASGGHSSVLLVTTLDDKLIRMGHTREITNRIQKLRKSLGISIDDQIEVFYRSTKSGALLASVASEGSEQVRKIIKMPYVPAD